MDVALSNVRVALSQLAGDVIRDFVIQLSASVPIKMAERNFSFRRNMRRSSIPQILPALPLAI